MTTVIRVKRKRDCEPAEALLLAARKKLKTDPLSLSGNIADVINIEEKVFRFAATVEPDAAQHQDVVADKVKDAIEDRIEEKELMKRLRKRKLPCSNLPKLKQFKSATISVCQSIFQKDKCLNNSSTGDALTKNDHKENNQSEVTKIPDCEKCTVYHHDNHARKVHKTESKVDDITCNNSKMLREKLNMPAASTKKSEDWVYDLYYCRNTNTNWDMSELLYIQPYRYTEEDLVNESESEDEYYEDEDDSNDEGNWRNDYPDEDDDDSSGSSSSSDDERERFMQQEEEEEEDEDEVDNYNQDDNNELFQLGMEDLTIAAPNDDINDFYDQGDDNNGGADDF